MLFALSFLLVFSSSYFIASIFTKKAYEHFVYTLLTSFANLVLTFEVLSLFKAISLPWVLTFNIIIFIVTFVTWFKKGKPVFIPDFKSFINRYKNICKIDKSFIVLAICFAIFMIGTFALCLFLPVTNADALDYHVARCFFYLKNGSFLHFNTADVRLLIFPINSEIIYSWILMMLKKDALLGFVSYFGFLLSITSIYKFMKLAGFSLRKILWSIFVLSSLASIIVQISGTETDVLTASLILSSIVLFWVSIKEKNIVPLIYSSLAYALSIGTKTTGIIAIPAVALIMLFLSAKFKNYKNFGIFCLLCTVNFLVFSSYNYILNLIDFGNIMGTTSSIVVHKNFYGIKGMVANFVRHIFKFFDFTGFKWGDYIGNYIVAVRAHIMNFLHVASIPEGVYSEERGVYGINGTLLEPCMGYGILGFIVFLPCVVYSMLKSFFVKNFKTQILAILSVSFMVFLLVLSYLISYMNFNVRFMAMFAVIAAPVFAYSYCRKNNFYKVLVIICMFYYMVLVSSHIWARPWWHFAKNILYKGETISDTRRRALCSKAEYPTSEMLEVNCLFWSKIENSPEFKNKKILYFPSSSTNLYLPMKSAYFDGANIDIGLIPKYSEYNLDEYDYLIFSDNVQYSTYFPEKDIKYDYKITKTNMILRKNKDYYCFYLNRKGMYNGTDDLSLLKDKPFAVECTLSSKNPKIRNFEYIKTIEDTNNEILKPLKKFMIFRKKSIN